MPRHNHYNNTKEFFDSAAIEKKGFYDAKTKEKLRHSGYQLNIRKKILELFKKLKTPNNLDVGCGIGDFTIELAKNYPNLSLVGIDFSKEAIKLAKNNSRYLKNIKFDVQNILSLKFKDKSFDTVFCINTLHHIKKEDLRIALKELTKISKNNIILEIKNNNNFYYKYIKTGFGTYDPKIINLNVYPTTARIVKKILREFDFKLIKTIPLFGFSFLSPILVLYFKRIK